MFNINDWAAKWGVPPAALKELRGVVAQATGGEEGKPLSEAAVSQRIRLTAARKGIRLWRNNVGAVTTDDGRHIRFGLANESSKMNTIIKSSDLIGITPYHVKRHDIGRTLGVFTSIEVKHSGWTYSGTAREFAQKTWLESIYAFGGFASFATSDDVLKQLT